MDEHTNSTLGVAVTIVTPTCEWCAASGPPHGRGSQTGSPSPSGRTLPSKLRCSSGSTAPPRSSRMIGDVQVSTASDAVQCSRSGEGEGCTNTPVPTVWAPVELLRCDPREPRNRFLPEDRHEGHEQPITCLRPSGSTIWWYKQLHRAVRKALNLLGSWIRASNPTPSTIRLPSLRF